MVGARSLGRLLLRCPSPVPCPFFFFFFRFFFIPFAFPPILIPVERETGSKNGYQESNQEVNECRRVKKFPFEVREGWRKRLGSRCRCFFREGQKWMVRKGRGELVCGPLVPTEPFSARVLDDWSDNCSTASFSLSLLLTPPLARGRHTPRNSLSQPLQSSNPF
jgi:hypothetical protein